MPVLEITKDNFIEEVKNSTKPVLLDCWASWCGPCKRVSPFVEQIAHEHPENKVGKVNVDEEMELAMRFGVTSIPLLVVMKDGKVVNKAVGAMPKAKIEALFR